jgi:hypothetical protein
MSRPYEMTVIVRGVDPAREQAVKEAAQSCWDFDDWIPLTGEEDSNAYQASGYGSLCVGEQEDEFADRLAREIWAANGGFCWVTVRAISLDDLPYESYDFDEVDYEQITAHANSAEH